MNVALAGVKGVFGRWVKPVFRCSEAVGGSDSLIICVAISSRVSLCTRCVQLTCDAALRFPALCGCSHLHSSRMLTLMLKRLL